MVALVVIEPARILPAASNDRSPSALLALLIAISLASDFLMVLAPAMIPALPGERPLAQRSGSTTGHQSTNDRLAGKVSPLIASEAAPVRSRSCLCRLMEVKRWQVQLKKHR
jgi:hypothetical protein